MITLEYFEVADAYDAEGKGPTEVIGRFTREGDAEAYARGRGNYGADARVIRKYLIISESLEESEDAKNERTRQAALAKLTDKEKRVLGLI